MKSRLSNLPFYIKSTILLVGFFTLISILSIGQDIILPILYATIMAILVSPLVNYFVKNKINQSLAITIVMILSTLVITALIILVSSQISRLSDSWPQLSCKIQELFDQIIAWVATYFDISTQNIDRWIDEKKTELFSQSSAVIGITLTTLGGALSTVFLTPVYIFMLLYYKPHLVKFAHKLFGDGHDNQITEILTETKTLIQNYLIGLFIELIVLIVLNSVGLLVLGIEYAILLGVIGAFLNVIPYIGGIIGVVLFMLVALVTKSPVYMFYVLILYSIIQLIDNNFIVPKIVGSKVKLNALVSIIVVIAGAALWGIPGMFLSIPIIAIIKLIFDRIESLKPWGFLLGDSMPETSILK